MTSALLLPRRLLILLAVVPVALFLGYQLATPDSMGSFLAVGLVLGALVLPVLLGYHHALLVFTWNLYLSIYFLPGRPDMWMLASVISFGISILTNVLQPEAKLQHVPAVTWSLIALAVVVVATAQLTGGIGLRTLGGGLYGGKKYVMVLFAILGCFALGFQRIPPDRAQGYAGGFFLAGVSVSLSNLLYYVPALWFLYAFFPVEYAMTQIVEDFFGPMVSARIGRLAGVGFGASAVFNYLLLRYGIRGLLDWHRPWRLLLAAGLLWLSLLGGFRSVLVMQALTFAMQFYFEGLHRTKLMGGLALAAVLGLAVLVPFADRLPLSVQRSLSFLPLKIDPAVRVDAAGSAEWRYAMWRVLIPEIPKYLWLGKGYTASESDYYLANESARRGYVDSYETSLIAGNYHNGPLSVIIPFGLWGVLAFVAFLWAGGRVLYLNWRHGPAALRNINTFLLAYYLARVVFFFAIFGAINSDMPIFAGAVGLSISLNGGLLKEPAEPAAGAPQAEGAART